MTATPSPAAGASPASSDPLDIEAGRRLIQAGLLHPDHARKALEMAGLQRRPLTTILLEHGLVRPDQLQAVGLGPAATGPAETGSGATGPGATGSGASPGSSASGASRLAPAPTPGASPHSHPPSPGFAPSLASTAAGSADHERTLLASTGSRARLPEPGDRIDNATVIRELGRGGMGAVYEVAIGETRFALKLVLTESEVQLERFEREARAAAAVDRHPNIVTIHKYDRYGGRPYILLDFVEGEGLDERIERAPPPLETGLEWIATIADALAFVHERDILHRDIKPANIMIRARDEAPLLSDFGLARAGDSEGLTKTGQVLGTPSYMAPEQADGDRHAFGPHTDTWALGIILYELATGRKPFEGETAIQLARAIMIDDPKPPSAFGRELPLGLEGVILRALEKEPAHRYADAAELARDLRKVLRGDHVEATASPLTRFKRRFLRRFGGRVAALGLLALIGLPVTLVAGAVAWSRSAALERLRIDVAKARERCATGLARLQGEPLTATLCAAVLHHDGRFETPPELHFETIRADLAPIASALAALHNDTDDDLDAAFQLIPAERRSNWSLLARLYKLKDPLAGRARRTDIHERFERGVTGKGPLDERIQALRKKVSGRLQSAADLALGLLEMCAAEDPSLPPTERWKLLREARLDLARPLADELSAPKLTSTEAPPTRLLRLGLPPLFEATARAAVLELQHPLADLDPRFEAPMPRDGVPALDALDSLPTSPGRPTPLDILNILLVEAAQRHPPGPADAKDYAPALPVRCRPDLVWRVLAKVRDHPGLKPPVDAGGRPPLELARYFFQSHRLRGENGQKRVDLLDFLARVNDLVTLARAENPDLDMPRWLVGAAVGTATTAIADPEGIRLGLKISIEMSRHGVLIGLLAGKRESLEKLHEFGAFGEEIDADPEDPFPRFWRGMRSAVDTRDLPPEAGPKQIDGLIRHNQRIIADLEFALKSERVRSAVRGMALHRLAIALDNTEALERRKSGKPQDETLRRRKIALHREALKYPSPHPDEIHRKIASRIIDKIELIVPANTRNQREALSDSELAELKAANWSRMQVLIRRCPGARDVGEDMIKLPPPAVFPRELRAALEPMHPNDYYDRMSQVCGQFALVLRLEGDPQTGYRWARRGMAFDKQLKRGGNSDSYWEALRCLLDLDREPEARALYYEIRDARRAGRISMKEGNLGQLSKVFEAWGGDAIVDWK